MPYSTPDQSAWAVNKPHRYNIKPALAALPPIQLILNRFYVVSIITIISGTFITGDIYRCCNLRKRLANQLH